MRINSSGLRAVAGAGLTAGALLCGALGAIPAATAADSHNHATTGWTALGKWHARTTYHVGDVVTYRGRTYVAVAQNRVRPRGSKKWKRVASNGLSGTNGAPGATGAAGAPGAAGTPGAPGATGAPGTTPVWWLADGRGTVVGEFLGTLTLNQVMYQVLYDGGVWWYGADGTYANLRTKLRTDDSAFFMDSKCEGAPYLAANNQISLGILAGDAGGMHRLAYSVQNGFVGYRIPAGASVTPNSGTLYFWEFAGSEPRDCLPATLDPDHFILPLQVTSLPPAATGGFHAVVG